MKNTKFLYRASNHLSWRSENFMANLHNIVISQETVKLGCNRVRKIHTHMTIRELNTLYALTKELGDSARVLEIGSYLGASSCYVASALALQNGHLFCVDTWENQTMPEGERDTYLEFQENLGKLIKYVTPIRKNSKDLSATDIIQPFNLIFLDGDHSYLGVKNDYEKTAPWVIGGGILAFHDCVAFEGVARVIGEALASGLWKFSGQVDNLFWLRKVEKGYLEFEHPAF